MALETHQERPLEPRIIKLDSNLSDRRHVQTPLKKGSSLLERRKNFRIRQLAAPCKLEPTVDLTASPFQHFPDAGKYEVLDLIGMGSVCNVYRARRRRDSLQVAMKVTRSDDQEIISVTEEEFKILKGISHPRIIQVFDFFATNSGAVLIMEFCKGQPLEKKVHQDGCFDEGRARQLCIWLIEAASYLHTKGIVHRDIQAGNVLVVGDCSDLKLVDFNTARNVDEGGSLSVTGMMYYRAPEVLLGNASSFSSDVWAIGICMYLMLSGHIPDLVYRFLADRKALKSALTHSVSFSEDPWQHVSQSCKAVVVRALAMDHHLRPTTPELLKSNWIRQHNAADDSAVDDSVMHPSFESRGLLDEELVYATCKQQSLTLSTLPSLSHEDDREEDWDSCSSPKSDSGMSDGDCLQSTMSEIDSGEQQEEREERDEREDKDVPGEVL